MEDSNAGKWKREIGRRAVLYVTKLCNIGCKFCYYKYEENKTHAPLDSIVRTFEWFKRDYQVDYVDLTGGEPTVHPDIKDIVIQSNKHGIKPTIITNAQKPDVFPELIDAGLEDVLLSVHGIGDVYNKIVERKNAFQKLEKTVEVLKKENFSFRTNTTLTSYSCEDIENILKWLKEIKPRIVNLIAFNPHEGTLWSEKMNVEFQISYSIMAEAAKYVIDELKPMGIWVNFRYIPMCFMKGYEEHVCNFLQWQFDPYEWEWCSSERISKEDMKKTTEEALRKEVFGENDYEKMHTWAMLRSVRRRNRFIDECSGCANQSICDGIYPQYLKNFGNEEFEALAGEKFEDPLYHRLKNLSWTKLKRG